MEPFFICSKPFEQVILDYDYTFTTPYCGSETTEVSMEKVSASYVSILFLQISYHNFN